MKNIDIETLYIKLKSQIALLKRFSEIESLPALIKSMRLKPYSLFTTKKIPRVVDCHWVDEFGNSVFFKKNYIDIHINDNILENTKISTDLFFGRTLEKTAKISKSKWSNNEFHLFWGKDEYFRCFSKPNEKPVAPLLVGINNILNYIENKLIIERIDRINAKG